MASAKLIEKAKVVEPLGHEIYALTFEKATSTLAKEVAKEHGITVADARLMILNAIIYNCVQEEIKGQIDWLLGKEKEEWND